MAPNGSQITGYLFDYVSFIDYLVVVLIIK